LNNSVEIIADSIGPNQKRITTFLLSCPRFILAESRLNWSQSVSISFSRDTPAAKLMKQVKENPWIPLYFPKTHTGMQSKEVWEPSSTDAKLAEEQWLEARDKAVYHAEQLAAQGVSNQIYNRLIEPWVTTRCICTSTEWDGFFKLIHPWHKETKGICNIFNKFSRIDVQEPVLPCPKCGSHFTDLKIAKVWGDEVDLNFPTEYNVHSLAIKMKKAMDKSTPVLLQEGEYHLPFITKEDVTDVMKLMADGTVKDENIYIKLSAARCASYDHNGKGRSLEMELDLAERLQAENHWSPFDHQAMAIDESASMCNKSMDTEPTTMFSVTGIPNGMELRVSSDDSCALWSNNFQNWVQAREVLES